MNHLGLSQAGQEEFVMCVLKNKQNGTFIEIGSEHPVINNNTFYLEKYLNWDGYMIEYNPIWEEFYKKWRKSKYHIGDALFLFFPAICDMLSVRKNRVIDYLQFDLEVKNESTIKCLEIFDRDVFDYYQFRVVTFEHDLYCGWTGEDTRRRSREIFYKRGYLRVFSDVKHNLSPSWCVPFEDWYVHPDLVNMEYIDKIKRDESLNHDDIINILHKNI
jgi:hypothetical protein